jgi:HK97 gp10 family phage protein
MPPKFELVGVRELDAAITRAADALTPRVQVDALTDAAEAIRARAAQLAPNRPGGVDLRDEIVVEPASRGEVGSGDTGVVIGPSQRAFYGSFQEFGTEHHRAQPFMRPAFDENVDGALSTIGDEFWSAIAREAK